jgi:hypothetical protein
MLREIRDITYIGKGVTKNDDGGVIPRMRRDYGEGERERGEKEKQGGEWLDRVSA